MGLFNKLGHGGVKVQVQAPSSVTRNAVIPVTVNISADKEHTINSLKAEIQAQAREQGFSFGNGMNQSYTGGVGIQEERTTYQTIAIVESREPLTVGPGETKTVNLQLYIDGTAGSRNNVGGATDGGLMGALQSVANVASNLEHVDYIYRVKASADVEGVSLKPSDHMPIQILPEQVAQTNQPVINNFQPNIVPTEKTAPPVQEDQQSQY